MKKKCRLSFKGKALLAIIGVVGAYYSYNFYYSDYSPGTCFSSLMNHSYKISSKHEDTWGTNYIVAQASSAGEEHSVEEKLLATFYSHKQFCDTFDAIVEESIYKAKQDKRFTDLETRVIKLEGKKK